MCPRLVSSPLSKSSNQCDDQSAAVEAVKERQSRETELRVGFELAALVTKRPSPLINQAAQARVQARLQAILWHRRYV